jgi:hypothetical protein
VVDVAVVVAAALALAVTLVVLGFFLLRFILMDLLKLMRGNVLCPVIQGCCRI